ncbi:MAG: hypothetical protein OEY93_08645, partial [Anaerolineae bacterium]|nr:hypothetical protein [Anaerolineae bacterium]
MKSRVTKQIVILIVFTVIFSACGFSNNNAGPTEKPNKPSQIGEVVPTIVSAPDASEAARAYLDAWGEFNYALMYSKLTKLSTDSILFQDFEARYKDVTETASLRGVSYEILQTLTNPTT